ncbi:DUF2059 domain-containing protein [Hahella sp. CR1]|uniref:DUF2059 domain-containing protein n=1 Tax=Hahella sp. CR1 TaxID=2992807 RepID=UPI00244100B1|nr:DUF2059 domain-containing protein [Hahella sp. CR1]MDG9669016.1 DUF2059 domain-containing protein [Hahella sp. CR1]
MMLKSVVACVMTAILLSPSAFAADDGAKKAAARLLDVMNMEVMMEHSIEQMMTIQLQQNPNLTPFRDVMMRYFKKQMSYDTLKGEFVKIYADAFTEKELNEIVAFYQTETGQKAIQKMPELMSKGAQLGASRVQANIQELQQMIKAEAERLKTEGGPTPQ